MTEVLPDAHVAAGVLVLIVGFGFHWVGQLISVLDWGLPERIGLQEAAAPPEYRVYEHGIAVADVAVGWIYGVAGVGLILGTSWGLKLARVPGVVMVYHAVGFWFWSGNQIRAGHRLMAAPMRVGWFLANAVTGALALRVAWG